MNMVRQKKMHISHFFLFAVALTNTGFAREFPQRFIGRWYFDEDATVKEWPRKAKTDEQRVRYSKIGATLKPLREKFGKPLVKFVDVRDADIVANGGVLNPRFEVLTLAEKDGELEVKARHFQVPDDDNPKEVSLRLSIVNGDLVLELWDENEIVMLYVLHPKAA